MKHRDNPSDERKQISLDDLYGKKDKDFYLAKYFISYLIIKERIKDAPIQLYIYTNTELNQNLIEYTTPVASENILGAKGSQYQFNTARLLTYQDKKDKKTLADTFKETLESNRQDLAKIVVAKLAKKELEPRLQKPAEFSKLLELYGDQLTGAVLEQGGKDERNNQVWKLRDRFLQGDQASLSKGAQEFRAVMVSACNGEEAFKNMADKKLALPKNFQANEAEQIQFISYTETDVKDFFNTLTFAVKQPNVDDLEKKVKEEIGKEYSLTKSKTEEVARMLFDGLSLSLTHETEKKIITDAINKVIPPVVYELDEPVQVFTGRTKALESLHNSLQNTEHASVISQVSSITGLGGIGKSQLAKKYAQAYQGEYTDRIWIKAYSPEESFRNLAKKLDISDKYIDDEGKSKNKSIQDIVKEVYQYFAKKPERRSLFIFDNAEDYQGIKAYLPNAFDGVIHCLITSRNQAWGNNINVFPLDIFTKEDSIELIENVLGKETTNKEEATKLANKLGHFPLALHQALAYIKRQKERGIAFKIHDYLDGYEKKTTELLNYSFPDEMNDQYTKTTFTTWQITVEDIEADPAYGAKAKELLDIISYFSPDDIPSNLFIQEGSDEEKIGGAIELLKKYSMINQDTESSLFNIHRLVQQVTRINLEQKKQEEEILGKALTLFKENVTKDNVDHLTFIWKYAAAVDQETLKYEELVNQYKELPNAIITALRASGRYEEGYQFGVKAKKALEKILLSDDDIIKQLNKNIGGALMDQSSYSNVLGLFEDDPVEISSFFPIDRAGMKAFSEKLPNSQVKKLIFHHSLHALIFELLCR